MDSLTIPANPISVLVVDEEPAVLELREQELLERLHRILPGVRDLRMAACVDRGVVRIQLIAGGAGMETAACDDGIVESIRTSASTPLVRRAGCLN